MSASRITDIRLPKQDQPVYITSQEAAPILGVSRPTLIKYMQPPPDAWYSGPHGKRWPLWLRTTLENHRPENTGGAS